MRIYIKPLIYVVNLRIENLLDNGVPVTASQGSGSTGQGGGQYAKGDFGLNDENEGDDQNYDSNIWGK